MKCWVYVTVGNVAATLAALVAAPVVSAANLFISGTSNATIYQYDTVTKAQISSFSSVSTSPRGMAFGTDGGLYVASQDANIIRRFNVNTTGSTVFAGGSLTLPSHVEFGPSGALYANSYSPGRIVRFNSSTGASLGTAATGGTLVAPSDFTFGPGGDLFVGNDDFNNGIHNVLRFDGSTGAYLGVFTSGGNLSSAGPTVFGPDGNL